MKETDEAKENDGSVAAFFDLDGTLVPRPSLEKRFFWRLRERRIIGTRNYLLWLREALRLVPRGIHQIIDSNKMYLQGLRASEAGGGADIAVGLSVTDPSPNNRDKIRRPRMAVPLYREAIERVAWHAERGHLLVIVSGTLKPLADMAARALEREISARGMARAIRVCANRLEEKEERWTGRIVGEAMFKEAKARAIRRVAAEEDLDLRRCFAYGNSSSDRWMLEAVGKPAAVNPSNDLARLARRNDWTVFRWSEEKYLQREPREQRERRRQKKHERDCIRDA